MQRIDFEAGAVASLKRRVAEIEEINDDLVAFARGHAGAVAAIHAAILAALSARDREELCEIVAWEWPGLLQVDAVALAWSTSTDAFRSDRDGIVPLEPKLVERIAGRLPVVTVRTTSQAHPLFARAVPDIHSEALIRLEGHVGSGLLLLGQKANASAEGRHGTRLLRFLGEAVSHIVERCQPR